MSINEGTVYILTDEFYDMAKDINIKMRVGGGNPYPVYCCIKDTETSLFWMVPMSLNIPKYRAVYDKEMERYGHCYSIALGIYGNKEVAFQIQSMFPVQKKHILKPFTKQGRKITVDPCLKEEVQDKANKMLSLHANGATCFLTDIDWSEKLMQSV